MINYLTEEQFNAIMACSEINSALLNLAIEKHQMEVALSNTKDAVKIKAIKKGIENYQQLKESFEIKYEENKTKVCGEPRCSS
jgi:DNA-binding protein H-NS